MKSSKPVVGREKTPGRANALHAEFQARIMDGTFAAGSVLPSSRSLAVERGVSRSTVSAVYEQLAAEGYVDTRTGAASRVAEGAARNSAGSRVTSSGRRGGALGEGPGRLSAIGTRIKAMQLRDVGPTVPKEIDFVYGPLSGTDFPTAAWMKAVRGVERQRSRRLEYEEPRGNVELRKALQAHLSRSRGLACSVDQLLIVSGSQQALDLCARMLIDPGDAVVIENPGYRMAHHVFEAYGATMACVDVDGHGLVTDDLASLHPIRMAYVTPTHQFPLGSFLPIVRRRQLLNWAAERKAWIIEDDYDSEYRYAVRPEATLQSMDTGGYVIYVGTFSKTLSPQLRLGYMVLPPALVEPFAAAKRLTDRHAPTGTQRALAALLADGSYDRHLRRIRRHQQARQRALVNALASHLGDAAQVQGASSGLHLNVWFPALPTSAEPALVEAARARQVRVYPISPLFHPSAPASRDRWPAGLVMGYALLAHDSIEEGVRRLADALLEVGKHRIDRRHVR